jgi:hypothetical protein
MRSARLCGSVLLPGNDLPLIHEFLSMMLGVRRSGVTIAVQLLEGTEAIKATCVTAPSSKRRRTAAMACRKPNTAVSLESCRMLRYHLSVRHNGRLYQDEEGEEAPSDLEISIRARETR